jgi:hypothetical protein
MQKISTPIKSDKSEENNSVKDSKEEGDGGGGGSEGASNLIWTPLIDRLLSSWCDHAKCFVWMHSQSHDICAKKTRSFMISTNVLTAFAGLANVIAGGITVNGFQTAWIFGGLSVLVSTLNVLQDKLGYAQRAEQHRKLANQWDIIRSKIEEIIILPINARKDCKSFLKYIKADINQASIDGNSLIQQEIKLKCYENFKNIENFDIPEICGNMHHTKTFNDTNVDQVKIIIKRDSNTSPIIINPPPEEKKE